MMMPLISAVLVATTVAAPRFTSIAPTDSPQFRGMDRTGISKETGLLKSWPAGGPKLVWSAKGCGDAHATPSIVGNRIYGMGLRGDDEVIWAKDVKTGKDIWSTPIAKAIRLDAPQGGNGSRSTPTVEGNRMYSIGVAGDVICQDTATGAIVWRRHLVKEFGGRVPTWGYSESVLIDGNNVIVTPGGAKSIVALNKKTGEQVWVSNVPGRNDASYSSAILADVTGSRQIIQFLAGSVVGVDAASGKFLWNYDAPACRQGINCSAPLYKDGFVFAASAYQNGGGLAKLTKTATGTTAEQVYFTKEMQNHHGGMVLVGDHIYGFDNSNLTCMEFKTGKVLWTDRSVGKGSVTFADGMLICRSERGPIALVEATPAKYTELGRFEQPERSTAPSWPYPVVSNGKLYIRDMDVLLCYDVKAGGK